MNRLQHWDAGTAMGNPPKTVHPTGGRDMAEPAQAAPADLPFVSVVVPHYNDLEALAVCLAGLARQTWPADRMEVVVADNNSACGLPAVARAAPGCRVVAAPVQGAGPARNAGAAAARGTILAFIDSDCDPRPDWIEHGVRALAAYDFVGGHVLTAPRDPRRPTPVEAWEMVFGFDFERYILVDGYTGSGNMWVWRSVFETVGGFRAGIAEDMEWSFRARAAGFRLGYESRAVVSHLARPSWPDLLARWRRVLDEHYALMREKRFGRLRWTVKTAAMPFSAGPHLLRVLRSDRLPDARAKTAAAAVLVAHRLWRTGIMARLLMTRRRAEPASEAAAQANATTDASVLGLPFTRLGMADAVAAVHDASQGAEWRYVVTPNAAHLGRLGRGDPTLLRIYTQAAFCFLDSRVVALALRLLGRPPPPVVPGSDLVEHLLRDAITPSTPVCIVGGDSRSIALVRTRFGLSRLSHMNPSLGFWADDQEVARVVAFVVASRADYTFLAVGSPQQEILAARVAQTGGARGVGLCIGASIEFIAGVQRRAPPIVQRLALEWAYRLCREPRRLAHRYLVESPRGVLFVLRSCRFAFPSKAATTPRSVQSP